MLQDRRLKRAKFQQGWEYIKTWVETRMKLLGQYPKMYGKPTGIAGTSDIIWAKITELTGLSKKDFHDLTPLNKHWDSHNFANALILAWALLNFCNHPWSCNEDFIKFATYNLVMFGKSTIMLISSRGDGTEYFNNYVLDLVEIHDIPGTTFIGYEDGLAYSLKLVFFCTPEVIQHFFIRRKCRANEGWSKKEVVEEAEGIELQDEDEICRQYYAGLTIDEITKVVVIRK